MVRVHLRWRIPATPYSYAATDPAAILSRMGDLGFLVSRLVRRYRDPVVGTLRLTAKDWRGSRVKYVGVVSAPGLSPTPVSYRTSEPTKRWVMDGMDLPVVVDRTRPAKLRILWKQVPTTKQYRANLQAQQMRQAAETAARMASGDSTAGTTPLHNIFAMRGNLFGDGGDLAQKVSNAIFEAFGSQSSTVWGESHVHMQISEGAPIVGGIRGSAIVIAERDVSVPAMFGDAMAGSLVDLTLEVTPPDGVPYPARARLVFSTPERRARIAAVGTRLPIRIDPTRRAHVEIDTAALNLD